MRRTPCIVCGTPTTGARCVAHQLQSRKSPEYRAARQIVLLNATRCAVCGHKPTVDDPLTLGHIVARANGGTLELNNLQAEHRSCNLKKGARDG